jgi:hypothetical protein
MLNLRRTTITANDPFAAVFLAGGHLGGLICDGARLHNESGPALYADRLRADHGVYLRAGFEATGTGQYGAVRLLNAHFASLECDGARIRNDAGPALYADELRVDNGMLLNAGFEAVGAGVLGAVNLRGAHLGSLYCGGAELRNESGPALLAARLRVDQDVFLRDGFVAVGAGERGAVNVIGAHFGELACSGAKLGNQSGPALIATRLRIDHKLYFDEVEALGGGDSVAVYLTDVHIGGAFVFNPTRLAHNTNPHARIDVDGLVYTGLPHGIATSEWLLLLAAGTPDYAAQPYQQLAAAHRAAGHDSQARRILMTQRRDQIHRRAITGRAERVWARFTGLALGYGYQPWRALIGLLVVVASAVTLAVILGDHGALTQVPARAAPTSSACTMVERVGVGLDLGVPLISTGSSARCQAADSATGQILTTTGWVLRLLAWAFATLFIAGFTGAVRKT